IFERGKGAATGRSLSPMRLFLRRAGCLRNGAAALGVGRRSRPGRPFRYDDEPAKMAVTCLALHCPPTNGSYLAGGGLENGQPCLRETARPPNTGAAGRPAPAELFEVRAHQCSQGGG